MSFLLPAKSLLFLLSSLLLLLLLLLPPSPSPVLLCCLSPPSPPHCRAATPEQSGGESSSQHLQSARAHRGEWGRRWSRQGKGGCHHCDVRLSHCDPRPCHTGAAHTCPPQRPPGPARGSAVGRGFRELPPPHCLLSRRGFPRLGLSPAMSPHGDTGLQALMGFLLPFPASSCLSHPTCLQRGARAPLTGAALAGDGCSLRFWSWLQPSPTGPAAPDLLPHGSRCRSRCSRFRGTMERTGLVC